MLCSFIAASCYPTARQKARVISTDNYSTHYSCITQSLVNKVTTKHHRLTYCKLFLQVGVGHSLIFKHFYQLRNYMVNFITIGVQHPVGEGHKTREFFYPRLMCIANSEISNCSKASNTYTGCIVKDCQRGEIHHCWVSPKDEAVWVNVEKNCLHQ